jgi:hypothetical protein
LFQDVSLVAAASLHPSVFAGGIPVVFDVAARQDAGEIVFDVESVLCRDPRNVDAEDTLRSPRAAPNLQLAQCP